MNIINSLFILILSFSPTLLGMDFSFNEEYRKEEIKGMSRQKCLDFRTKQLHQLKEEAIEEILATTGISKKELDEKIEEYQKLPDLYTVKKAYHDTAIPQEILSIFIKTLQEEGINPNNITMKSTNDRRVLSAVRLILLSRKNNHVNPIKLYINVDNLLSRTFFENLFLKKYEVLCVKENILHEISHIKNNDQYYRLSLTKILLDEQIKHDPNSKDLNQKNTLLINRFIQSYERIAMVNPSFKSQLLAQYMKTYFQTFELENDSYPPMKDVREWSTRLCDCWDLPEEKN